MTDPSVDAASPADLSKRPDPASGLIRLLYSHNPFYVISADLVFIGLRMSFDPSAKAFDTWALMSGLAGFTLLLAVTACLLVRYGKVWDDMRSVLLLVVMMFLAISATIDDVLINRPGLGLALAGGGLAFALLVSEGLMRGMRLGMPALYRGPYYLILALFFAYPVALRPLLAMPESVTSHWALFGFSTAAGLAFLTLIPAIRRGGRYVKGNGSPWRWPLYPWSLFFFLGLGVCARSYYLCISLHNVEGYRSIFGPYFLVPFGFAIAALLLEAGLTSRRVGVARFALMMPLGLVALTMVGHRTDPVYERFLALFQEGSGVTPPAAALLLAVGFYGVAAWRSVPLARDLAMVSLLALSVVGEKTIDPWTTVSPRAWPLAAVGLIQIWLTIRRPNSLRAFFASACLAVAVACFPGDFWPTSGKLMAAGHLGTLGLLSIGAVFKDEVAEMSRRFAGFALSWAALAFWVGVPQFRDAIPPLLAGSYPWILAAVAAGYGMVVGGRAFFAIAGAILSGILVASGSKGYLLLRQQVSGLDRIALGLASFVLATLISLGKAGVPRRWLGAKGHAPGVVPQPTTGRSGP